MQAAVYGKFRRKTAEKNKKIQQKLESNRQSRPVTEEIYAYMINLSREFAPDCPAIG